MMIVTDGGSCDDDSDSDGGSCDDDSGVVKSVMIKFISENVLDGFELNSKS